MTERIIEANGVGLCTEPFGDPADPPILLVMGLGASMVWWDEEFCRMLAEPGRFVIRYDHRDTGRSVTYEPGRPGYSGADLVADAAGVLAAFGLPAAHVVGLSAGGALAQRLALGFPERVSSLTLISTSLAVATDRALPPPSAALMRFYTTAEVDWSDPDSVSEYRVAHWEVLAGEGRTFDADRCRTLARHEVERARDFAAAQNHDLLHGEEGSLPPVRSISAPTLVVHGTADPLFPIEHGEALADEIPGAELLRLDGAGHGVDQADWQTITAAILRHA